MAGNQNQEGDSIIATAYRGLEVTGSSIFQLQPREDSTPMKRCEELMAQMHKDQPSHGTELSYGDKDSQILRFWRARSDYYGSSPPLIVFVHGGSWRAGTHLDSLGATKVEHLTNLGFAFATVNYTLIHEVTVEQQVQEVADCVGYLVKGAKAYRMDFFDPSKIFLMGHSSGAHVATLLGTDTRYFERAGVDIGIIRGVLALDGSNYNAMTESLDSPGPVLEGTKYGLGTDPERLRAASPTYHASAPNAGAFLLLQVQRHGDIRQAIEFEAVLRTAGTDVALHVFEGESFEGHMQMLLRLGHEDYPATVVLEKWLREKAR